ncbi:MAG: hypothetical protein ABIU84_11975 [Thermoanaerobaculia bacterium]
MKRNLRRGLLLTLLCAVTVTAAPVHAEGKRGDRTQFSAGEEIARTITLTTGVPISPMLGVSALGAWRWWKTPADGRAALPWYAQPWFWGSGLFLVFLFAANTTIGAAVPGLKKPMDFVEEHENKVSALLASPIVLLEVKRLLGLGFPALAGDSASAHLGGTGLALVASALPVDGVARLFVDIGLGVLYLTCFFTVFIAFHAIQVMIALSPSALLDMLLRTVRLSFLGLLGLSAWIHPYLGAAIGFAILFVAWLIAGWSFRLTVFGSVLSWEFLTGKDGSADPATAPLAAFSQRGLKGVKVRSLGRLTTGSDGAWNFVYRPWLILPRRTVPVPVAGSAVLKGAISPLLVRQGPLRTQTLVRFPPRFRTREAEVARRLGVADVLEGRIVRGFRAAWQWLKESILGIPWMIPEGAPESGPPAAPPAVL